MKSLFKYTFMALLGGAMLVSCSEEQIETVPTQSMSGQGLLATGKAALVPLNGIYREMYTSGWSTTGNTHQCFGITAYTLCADVMGEDHVMADQGSGWFWFDACYNVKGRFTSSAWRSYDLWFAFYTWISNANYIIAAEETMGGSTEEKNYAIGQAYAIRAYCYFMLSQYFARTLVGHENEPCVPLYSEPTTPKTTGQPRSTNAEVYAQIDADINKACELLKGIERYKDNRSHINYAVAEAIKARICMVENKWADAKVAAHEAIDASGCKVIPVASFMGMNNVNADNVMWGAEIITDQVGMYASLFSHMDYLSKVSYALKAPKCINKELYAKMGSKDTRRAWWFEDASKGLIQQKFRFSDVSTWMGDYIFMRVEEMYLTAAEAECRLGEEDAAKKDLMAVMSQRDANYNTIKSGTSLGKTSAKDEETGSLLEEILIQRRIELWGEFGRMYDLKRLKQGFRRTSAMGWPDGALIPKVNTQDPEAYCNVLTIPQAEFDGNENMDGSKDQNPTGDYK